jgi:hypothetical protein
LFETETKYVTSTLIYLTNIHEVILCFGKEFPWNVDSYSASQGEKKKKKRGKKKKIAKKPQLLQHIRKTRTFIIPKLQILFSLTI